MSEFLYFGSDANELKDLDISMPKDLDLKVAVGFPYVIETAERLNDAVLPEKLVYFSGDDGFYKSVFSYLAV